MSLFIYYYAECHYAECRYAERRGAIVSPLPDSNIDDQGWSLPE